MINDKMTRQLIQRFLTEFKTLVSNGKLNIIPRRYDYASKVEMNIASIKMILMKLTVSDYIKGPEEDRDMKDEYLWVFKKDDSSLKKIYIKLKIVENNEARVISFHYDR